MKYFIVAGEKSGDLHGSNLIKGIRKSDPMAVFYCWGGERMEEAGATLLMHYRKMAFMGFVNVLLNIRTIFSYLSLCKKQISEAAPDVLILIDYPGFNLKLAQYAKLRKLKVFYYISPKLWAWNEKRVEKIKLFVDRMFIIFPFEAEFYKRHGIDVQYYGNPLVDEITSRKTGLDKVEIRKSLGLDDRPVIAMLSGSRKHEVEHILPVMVKAASHFTKFQFILAAVDSVPEELYLNIIGKEPVKVLKDRTYEVLFIAEAAMIKSGTSTLEAALFRVPQVVCYKGDSLSFAIARRLVKVKFISLVNLIMEREVVKELIQFMLTEENLVRELNYILPGAGGREKMLSEYSELERILGPAGASDRISAEMVRTLNYIV